MESHWIKLVWPRRSTIRLGPNVSPFTRTHTSPNIIVRLSSPFCDHWTFFNVVRHVIPNVNISVTVHPQVVDKENGGLVCPLDGKGQGSTDPPWFPDQDGLSDTRPPDLSRYGPAILWGVSTYAREKSTETSVETPPGSPVSHWPVFNGPTGTVTDLLSTSRSCHRDLRRPLSVSGVL